VKWADSSEGQLVHIKAFVYQHLHNFCAPMLCRKSEGILSSFNYKKKKKN